MARTEHEEAVGGGGRGGTLPISCACLAPFGEIVATTEHEEALVVGEARWNHAKFVCLSCLANPSLPSATHACHQFGEIVATTEHEEALVVGEVDLTQIDIRRQNMPIKVQRRADLYQLMDKTAADQ
ncbi:unnamed protein product [Closterium sp. NIES-65]|nr:unnamed protein product [Closterium sp. NIES-65]